MPFETADEVNTYIGGIFEAAFDNPEVGPKLADTGIVLRVTATDPDTSFVVDLATQTVSFGPEAPNPNAALTMSADVHNQYWQGKVNLPFAIATKKVKLEGNVALMLKLAPLSKSLTAAYVERLTQDGRTDLLL
jgi:putative sterol carrier protein